MIAPAVDTMTTRPPTNGVPDAQAGGADRAAPPPPDPPPFDLPPPGSPDAPSVLVFGLYKAGSTLLHAVAERLAPRAGLAFCNVAGELFRRGVQLHEAPRATARLFHPAGYCYAGFREMPRGFDIPILDRARSVLLVRDPRDILVSHYFSVTRSHVLPAGGSARHALEAARAEAARRTVDEHVAAMAPWISELFRFYRAALAQPGCRVYRYEDVVFDKPAWLASMCRHFGWAIPQDDIAAVAAEHDLRPAAEDPHRHVRRVRPGDFREKLRPETIAALNESLAHLLDRFGYAP